MATASARHVAQEPRLLRSWVVFTLSVRRLTRLLISRYRKDACKIFNSCKQVQVNFEEYIYIEEELFRCILFSAEIT